MNNYNRLAMQAANAIHTLLQQQASLNVMLPEQLWQETEVLTRKISKADQQGWYQAAKRLRGQYRELLQRIRFRIEEMERELKSALQPRYQATLHTIYDDIASLEEDFDDVLRILNEFEVFGSR